jgi:hypothetical protein
MSKEKDKKKSGEKTKRKAPPPRKAMRKYKDSPAGHFSDKIEAHTKALNKIGLKMFGWAGVESLDLTNLKLVKAQLDTLAAKNFTPPRKKGGGRGININPGMKIYLKTEGIDFLKAQFPEITTDTVLNDLYIGLGTDPNLKMQAIRVGSGEITKGRFISFVPRNMLSVVPVDKEADAAA